ESVTITPFAVSHCTADFNPATREKPYYCCASFLVETPAKKAVLLWDVDDLNSWIVNPETDAHRQTLDRIQEPDYLFVDCNAWAAVASATGSKTGHPAFMTVIDYARHLRLKDTSQTVLLHLSGHEDQRGNSGWGWDDLTWQRAAQAEWTRRGIAGAVCVPKIGDEFEM
ncbi:MAG: hypothetical protein SCK70_16855, partial [bacterium]|nr:hypothetical protein [bacterium]